MLNRNNTLTTDFIEHQRKRLAALRAQLLGGEAKTLSAEREFQEERGNEAREFEEDAQDVAQHGVHQAHHDVDSRRLSNIARALRKIGEGSYGLSDESDEPIPQGRLEAVPEAVLTEEEEESKGLKSRRG
jgi:DnaK suppressor protein